MNNPPETKALAQPSTAAVWRGLASLLVITMESLWFSAWYDGLTKAPAGWGLKIALLWAILLISQVLTRRVQSLNVSTRRKQLLFLGWILTAVLSSLRLLFFAGQPASLSELGGHILSASGGGGPAGFRVYWHLLILLLIVGRGVLLGNQTTNRGNTAHSFQTGLILFLVYGVFFGAAQPTASLALLFAYLAAGLPAMSFARIADLGTTRGGRLPPFNAARALSILLSTASVILAAGLAGVVFNEQVTDAIAEMLLALVAAVMGAIIFLLSPILAFILELLFKFGQRIFTNVSDIFQESAAEAAAEQAVENSEESVKLIGELISKSLPLVLGAVLLVVVLLVILQLRKNRARPEFTGEEDQTESIRGRRPRFRMPFGAPSGAGGSRFRPGRMIAAARIRRTYALLMELCEEMGIPRPPAVTPLEFLPNIVEALPNHEDDLKRITTAYLKVRYGEIPETGQEVKEVVSAWERVRQAGKVILAKHRQEKVRRSVSRLF